MGEGGGGSRGYRKEVAECDKLPVKWRRSLSSSWAHNAAEIGPVQVLLGETENARSKKKNGELRENQEVDTFEIAK